MTRHKYDKRLRSLGVELTRFLFLTTSCSILQAAREVCKIDLFKGVPPTTLSTWYYRFSLTEAEEELLKTSSFTSMEEYYRALKMSFEQFCEYRRKTYFPLPEEKSPIIYPHKFVHVDNGKQDQAYNITEGLGQEAEPIIKQASEPVVSVKDTWLVQFFILFGIIKKAKS